MVEQNFAANVTITLVLVSHGNNTGTHYLLIHDGEARTLHIAVSQGIAETISQAYNIEIHIA